MMFQFENNLTLYIFICEYKLFIFYKKNKEDIAKSNC